MSHRQNITQLLFICKALPRVVPMALLVLIFMFADEAVAREGSSLFLKQQSENHRLKAEKCIVTGLGRICFDVEKPAEPS